MYKGRAKNKGRVKSLFGKILIFWIELWKMLLHSSEQYESKKLKLILRTLSTQPFQPTCNSLLRACSLPPSQCQHQEFLRSVGIASNNDDSRMMVVVGAVGREKRGDPGTERATETGEQTDTRHRQTGRQTEGKKHGSIHRLE